jgi:hypothetical protein
MSTHKPEYIRFVEVVGLPVLSSAFLPCVTLIVGSIVNAVEVYALCLL